MMKDYSDIIALKRPTSKKHPPMSLRNRAAQFAPFAALTGYEEAILEEGRITGVKHELTEAQKLVINDKLLYLSEHLNNEVEITYFIPDLYKSGGEYTSVYSYIKRIDQINKCLILKNKMVINFIDIIDIKADCFNVLYFNERRD